MLKPTKGRVTNRIKDLRTTTTDMTQEGLALKVGATRQTIIAIEAGKYAPSMELAFRIVLAFGLKFDEVFTFDPDG